MREQPSEVLGCVSLCAPHHQDELACFVDLAGDRQGGGVLSVTGEQGNGHAPGHLRRAACTEWPWLRRPPIRPPGGSKPAFSLWLSQLKRVRQQPDSGGARRPHAPSLQVPHRALAQLGPLGQLLLRQEGPAPARPHQRTKRAVDLDRARVRVLHEEVPLGLQPLAPGAALFPAGLLGRGVGHPQHAVGCEPRREAGAVAHHRRIGEFAAQRLDLDPVSDGLKVAHLFPPSSVLCLCCGNSLSGSRAMSDTGPRWPSLSGLTTARIVWTTPSATSSPNTVNTRPAASYPTAPGWPLTQASRREVPRDRPRRKRPSSSRATRSCPCSGALIVCALPPPSAWNTTSGASMRSSASMSPPAAASKNLRASSSPCARRAGGGALPRTCAPTVMRCLARAKICRQFTSVLPVTLATSG